MIPRRLTDLGARKEDLEAAARDRLRDAFALQRAKRYSACIVSCLYALEISLKAIICKRLETEQLPQAFEIHDLEGLLMLTGLRRKLFNNSDLHANWSILQSLSKELNDIRYRPGRSSDKPKAKAAVAALTKSEKGVLSWLKRQA